jgi:hypothetical protein
MIRINNDATINQFSNAAYEYFRNNKNLNLTWKQFCEGMKDMENYKEECNND